MNIHESAEDHLETILKLREDHGMVRSIDIVHELGFSNPSVTPISKALFFRRPVTGRLRQDCSLPRQPMQYRAFRAPDRLEQHPYQPLREIQRRGNGENDERRKYS